MKKCILCFVAFLVALSMCSGCVKKTDAAGEKLSVVCTIFPQYDFVREIAGNMVDLKMLLPMGVESHDFKLENLTVTDLNMVGSADLFIYIGGESDEQWVGQLKDTVKNESTRWLALTDMVDILSEEESESMTADAEHDSDHDHGEDEYDEHVWTSFKRAAKIVSFITDALCELDPDNSDAYSKNCDDYIGKLNALDNRMVGLTESAARNTLIFADRFPFRYLCDDYGIEYDAAFKGCSSSADPSVAQITSLCERAESTHSTVIFYMENSNTVYAEQIAEKVGAKTLMLHSCHTVTKAEFSAGVTYLSLMEKNIENISEALG